MRDGTKRAVLVWHRRAGKEKTCWNYMIMRAIRKPGIYYYFFPHFSQGRKILWDGIDKDGFRFLDHIPKEIIEGNPNATEMKIRIRSKDDATGTLGTSIIQIIGTNNIDSIVGTNPIGCVFTEYSLQDPTAWQLIRPILTENGGWAVFNFTPRGANHGKDLFEMAKANPNWYCQLLTVDDTGIITPQDIQAERDAGMSEDFIQQEFYCSFTLGIEGSYYAKYMQEAREEDRIGHVPWDKNKKVYTVWDIGYGDSCAIIMYQVVGNEVHLIDYYENHGEGLSHYVSVLNSKPYIYGDHFGPHDIDSHAFSSGMSAKEVGHSLGIGFITLPTLKIRLEEGIEALRGLFPRLWIDETKCKGLIKCLENYRKEFDQRLETYKERPLHDKYSHGCFVGETLIDCKGGKKRIDEIVEGDLVLTPNGHRRVLKTFCYESADLLKVTTTSSSVICTSNHKIFTNESLTYADSLRYNTVLESNNLWSRLKCRMKYGLNFSERSIGFRESFLSAKTNVRSSSTGTSFDGMVSTTQEGSLQRIPIVDYNAAFGLCTTVQSQKAITSTTKMETLKTTLLRIWNVLVPANTQNCILLQISGLEAKKIKNNCCQSMKRQNLGIPLRKEEFFIKQTRLNAGKIQYLLKKFVKCAHLRIKPDTKDKLNSAQMDVRQRLDTCPESTKKSVFARFAKRLSGLTSMFSKERVLRVVPLRLPTTQKVYDFEVDKDHCYYANSILVSNSDAARYLAIAMKRNVDSAKSGITDEQSEKWYKQNNPRFE